MAKKRNRVEASTLSFLDVIACGFGAIILLLVITKTAQPMILEETRKDLEGLVSLLEQQLFEIRGDTVILDRTKVSREQQLSDLNKQIARLRLLLSI